MYQSFKTIMDHGKGFHAGDQPKRQKLYVSRESRELTAFPEAEVSRALSDKLGHMQDPIQQGE